MSETQRETETETKTTTGDAGEYTSLAGGTMSMSETKTYRRMETRVAMCVGCAAVFLAVLSTVAVVAFFHPPRAPYAVGHRGASGEYPENTIPAVAAALANAGAAVEFDVQVTKDGVVVGMHDKSVDRTTDGSGLVADLEWAYIATLDAGVWKGEQFAGVAVPRLEDVVALMDGFPNGTLLLDVKDTSGGLLPAIAAALESASPAARATVKLGCWTKKCLREANDAGLADLGRIVIAPVPLVFSRSGFAKYADLGVDGFNVGLHLGFFGLCKPWTDLAHRVGNMIVWVWTIDSERVIDRVSRWGVDGIVTNYPSRVGPPTRGHGAKHGPKHGHKHGGDGPHHGDAGAPQHGDAGAPQHGATDPPQHGATDPPQHGATDPPAPKHHGHKHRCPHAEAAAAIARACILFHDDEPLLDDEPSPIAAFLASSPSCAALAACPAADWQSGTIDASCADLANAFHADFSAAFADPPSHDDHHGRGPGHHGHGPGHDHHGRK